ncbi:MAG: hypothetical protein RLZZ367_2337 [Bacteroidota bacterium]
MLDYFCSMQNNYDLIIVGGGPTGLVLANLAGKLGLTIAVIEKQKEVYPIPRATHIDEETMRNFQLTGLMPLLKQHTAPFGKAVVVNHKAQQLLEEHLQQNGVEHGYTGSYFFHQPAFEKIMRQGLSRYPNVDLMEGYETTHIQQNSNCVKVTAKQEDTSQTIDIVAKWAVGCDGGRSLVRNTLNIPMDAIEPAREWVIVDTILKDPADAALLPNHFRYILNNDRVTLFAYGIGTNNRWEFQLCENEPMPNEATILQWVAEYIPLQKIEVTRIARYAHNSLIARRWRDERILLAGDAAHMMPPFAGQGMCSGVRDAVNLAWKLEAVIKQQAPITLLDSYEQERKEHLQLIFKRTLFLSEVIKADTATGKIARNLKLRLIAGLPGLKKYLQQKYDIPARLHTGKLFTCKLSGKHLPQVAIAGRHLQSDDLTGYCSVVISKKGALTSIQLKNAETKNIRAIHNPALYNQWLNQHGIDFAIVRPDKIIFGTGKATQFDEVLAAI